MKIIIGEGSCGIAAGAAKIHDYFAEHAQFAELSITGCIGMCYLEPIVDVIEDGMKRTYCKVSTDLLPEFTAALERRDFEGAFLKIRRGLRSGTAEKSIRKALTNTLLPADIGRLKKCFAK